MQMQNKTLIKADSQVWTYHSNLKTISFLGYESFLSVVKSL